MKIKHFAGYGSVNAKKVYANNEYTTVEVWGNHEWGLTRPFDDPYCIENWLGRFIKGKKLDHYEVLTTGYKKVDNIDTEYAVYMLYTV